MRIMISRIFIFYVSLERFLFLWRRCRNGEALQNVDLASALVAFERDAILISFRIPCNTGPLLLRANPKGRSMSRDNENWNIALSQARNCIL